MESKSKTDDLVITLVELALTRPEDEREAYLKSACGTNSDLFAQAWSYVEWEKRMKGFLLDPLRAPAACERPFQPGDLLLNRFRVLREIAQGGMGIVWEAMDEKLDRRVALKCAKSGFGQQLPPEVRNAREISHPNVCKIFEIHTTPTPRGDIDFIAMEFLEGATLADRLRRSPLPKSEADAIARQLCAGLSEAHRNNVIHGDLKSNNVILATAPNGSVRAVITDFGLARRAGNDGWRTSTVLAGTPAYMAPELWKGAPASVASDLCPLGVILWELKSGKKPEELGVTSSTLTWDERLSWKPPPGHGKWERIIGRCLDPDPKQRFRNADAVSRALGPSRAVRWLSAAALAMILIAATGLAVYRLTKPPQETVRLAVAPFTSAANAAPVADKLWRDSMSQISRLRGNAHTKFTVAAGPRGGAKATHIVRVKVELARGNLIVRGSLSDARSGVTTKEWTAEYNPGETRYAGTALAAFVAQTLELPPLIAHLKVNAHAQQDYTSALQSLLYDSGVDAALAAMQKAVAEDPDSALTHAGLAEAQWRKYFITKQTSWLDRAANSAKNAQRRNPDLPEVHRIVGLLNANKGLYELAIVEYQRAIELDPDDSDVYRRLGEAYESNGQLGEALAAFQKAIEIKPDSYRAHQDLGAFYFQRGAYADATVEFRKAVELAPNEPATRFALGSAYMDVGRFADAERELRVAIHLREMPASLETLGLVLMYERRETEAIPYLLRTCILLPDWCLPKMHLGICYRRTNQKSEAARVNRRGLSAAEMEVVNNPRRGKMRSFLAYLCASLGDRSRAESEVAQALQLSPDDADTRFMSALTYEVLGRRDDTLAVLGASSNEVIADLSRWPDVADLHRDSRFLELLTSHGIR